MTRLTRWLVALAAPLLLTSCILTPGKFVSTLDIRADRSFTFTYVGEVLLAKTKTPSGLEDAPPASEKQGWQEGDDADPQRTPIALTSAASAPQAEEKLGDSADDAAQLKTLAQTLSKEYGFRSVRYIGNRKLAIDYAIHGTLDHAFLFPFNPDGDVLLPFIAIELRGRDHVRVKAPGYASQQSLSPALGGLGGMGADANTASELDGTFTLTTNATIVSQNQEEGAQPQPDGAKKIVWRVTPQTKDAPMAVLKLNPLP